jgi:hypothetical protein
MEGALSDERTQLSIVSPLLRVTQPLPDDIYFSGFTVPALDKYARMSTITILEKIIT